MSQQLLDLAKRAAALKSDSKHTNEFIRELCHALESASEEHALLKLYGEIMRALVDQVTGILKDLATSRQANVDDAKALQAAADKATADAATIADLTAKLAVAGTPTDPNDVIPSDNPLRATMDQILDADAQVGPVP